MHERPAQSTVSRLGWQGSAESAPMHPKPGVNRWGAERGWVDWMDKCLVVSFIQASVSAIVWANE